MLQGNSDWMIGTADQEIQIELLNGWAAAAHEIESLPDREIDGWLIRRKAAVDQQRFNDARGSRRLPRYTEHDALTR